MTLTPLLATLAVLIFLAYQFSRHRANSQAIALGGQRYLSSLPLYYGMLAAIWCALPALLVLLLWSMADEWVITQLVLAQLPETEQQMPAAELSLLLSSVQNLAAGQSLYGEHSPAVLAAAQQMQHYLQINLMAKTVLVLAVAVVAGVIAWVKISPALKARYQIEKIFAGLLLLAASVAIVVTVGIVFSVLLESIRFFHAVPITDFLLGSHWSPQTALRADQVGASGSFGALPLFTGTLLISAIAMLVAVPTGLMSAIYLAEYANRRVRNIVKPLLEILAGIPTVVYGFFAALTVAPAVRNAFAHYGIEVSSESALAAGVVMGVMIIPFVSSLADDVISAVPSSMRDGSLGLGATHSETIKRVIIPAALPGIVGGILLAVSRAIGETMIVVMAAGLAANLTANPLESVTTVTVQIVTLLVGDQEFDSPKTLAAFALGLTLFVVTLGLNFIALHVVKRYREQYE
ncbi:phosphate ABC transporter permease subunit PstC [Halioxenophilus sp. WMMB6]|uniref:phosphate ABC transporter permease subunit PstC n=1 Tax=Halioxenophilus sp. WMMB6 TaxID=3073815 RepID=UPI00295E4602|nr:phosphate ABC transporter permease subunit PstC [Halioxenophilus sp. WMMB6]